MIQMRQLTLRGQRDESGKASKEIYSTKGCFGRYNNKRDSYRKELAEALKKTAAEVIKKLFLMGITATQNQEIDFETAEIISDEFGVKVHKAVVISQEDILFDDTEDNDEELESEHLWWLL